MIVFDQRAMSRQGNPGMASHSRNPVRDQQLAKIIANELPMILATAGDSRLQELEIVHVEPKPGGRHFVVVYGPPSGTRAEVTDIAGPDDAKRLLTKAHGYIRSELALSMNLKNAPDLIYAPEPVRWAKATSEWLDVSW